MDFCVVFSGNNYQIEQIEQTKNTDVIQPNQSHSNSSNQSNSNAFKCNFNENIDEIVCAATTAVPKTIDELIECIAINGDQYEEKIIDEISRMNEPTLFR